MGERIAVLGAGPMGLAVAYQLCCDGHQPIIFEADDRVGGMTACFDFAGIDIERFYHFHCLSDQAFLQLLTELQISQQMHWVETKMAYWYQGKIQAWGNPLALLQFQGLGWLAKFRYGLHAFLATKRNKWQDLDQIEAAGWIKKWVGTEAWEVLWRRLFDYKFYHYSDNLSAAWIWSRIRRIGRSRSSIFHEKLGYLRGGSATLLNSLSAFITAHGGEIRLACAVNKVEINNGKVQGVHFAGKFEQFDKVISTIPLPYVNRLIPDLPEEIASKFQEIKNIAVVCVIVKLKKALTDNFWLNINDQNMDIPGLVEYSNLHPLSAHIIYVPFYMPSDLPTYQNDNDYFTAKVRSYLKKINSNLTDDDILAIHASRYRYAQPICPPNYLQNLPDVALPIKGLWVADTSYYYPEDRGISESIGFGRKMAKMATE